MALPPKKKPKNKPLEIPEPDPELIKPSTWRKPLDEYIKDSDAVKRRREIERDKYQRDGSRPAVEKPD